MKFSEIQSFEHYLDLVIEYLDEDRHRYPEHYLLTAQVEGELKAVYRLRTIYKMMKEQGKA